MWELILSCEGELSDNPGGVRLRRMKCEIPSNVTTHDRVDEIRITHRLISTSNSKLRFNPSNPNESIKQKQPLSNPRPRRFLSFLYLQLRLLRMIAGLKSIFSQYNSIVMRIIHNLDEHI